MNFNSLQREEMRQLFLTQDKNLLERMFTAAYDVKKQYVGTKVYFRGIIEFSNICQKNCFYCGIRKDNKAVKRYLMPLEEILEAAAWADEQNYGSVVLQSGERTDEEFISYVENALRKIKELSCERLGITLSLGEQTKETYERWFKAGAHRYLLRIETSNAELYRTLHPEDHSFPERLRALANLKETGYQVGTGVMIGLPGQTTDDLINDILFFKEADVAMLGMGPYLPHHDTPLKKRTANFDAEKQLDLALRMIALCRLYLKDVNIASTTALQALKHNGREIGLQAGANIIMPVITAVKYREDYLLYDNKPCLDENASVCRTCLEGRIKSIGEMVGYGEWGDSPHFLKK